MVGIVHTNYLAYSSGYSVWGPVLTFMLRWVRMHAYLRCKRTPPLRTACILRLISRVLGSIVFQGVPFLLSPHFLPPPRLSIRWGCVVDRQTGKRSAFGAVLSFKSVLTRSTSWQAASLPPSPSVTTTTGYIVPLSNTGESQA